jgi:hypothetical protein
MNKYKIGDRIRVRFSRRCGHSHALDADGRIGTISGMVTAELLSHDNASAADPRDFLTFEDFGDHVYGVDFSGPESPDTELCSLNEMEPLPAWAAEDFRPAATPIRLVPSSWARRRRPRTWRPVALGRRVVRRG